MDPIQSHLSSQPLHPGLEALDDGFCMLDASWRITYWNAAAARLLKISRAEVLGRILWERLPQLRVSAAWNALHEARQGGAPERFLAPDPVGRPRSFLSIRAAPLPDGGVALHFRDASAEVRRAERYSMLLESIRDCLVAVDDGGSIVYVNAAAEALLDFPRERAVGASIWSILRRGPPEIVGCLRATLGDGQRRHLSDVRPGGRALRGRVFDLWVLPLASGGISLLFEEVSDRVRREGELARLATEAREANRAKGRFFAAISHELRTPLNAIVGYTHLLATGTYGSLPEGADRAAERAGVCAEHLSRLVDDVLLLTTSEIGRLPVVPSPVELADFLPGVLRLHRNQAEAKGLDFRVELPDGLAPVVTDPQRLRQLLGALLSNAVKFTARGEVCLRVEIGADESAGGPRSGESTWVEFHVSDTGPGIDADDRDRIFGAFEQVRDPARSESMLHGSGLGLTVARRLATLLRGSLELAESSSRGSRFCLRLPLAYRARGV